MAGSHGSTLSLDWHYPMPQPCTNWSQILGTPHQRKESVKFGEMCEMCIFVKIISSRSHPFPYHASPSLPLLASLLRSLREAAAGWTRSPTSLL